MKMKDLFKNIKELSKTTKGKAILFFGFYFVFFIIIMFIARFGSRNYTKPSDYEKGKSGTFYINDIVDKNYSFTYQVSLDNVKYTYTGTRNSNNTLFDYNGNNYFSSDDKYFINNSIWSKCDNPIMFYNFINPSKLTSILENSWNEANTSYEDGRHEYSLLISTNTLNQLLDSKNTDYDDVPNKIVVSTDSDKIANKITYNLDSYCKLNNLCDNSLSLEISYDRFGKIEGIDNPIE